MATMGIFAKVIHYNRLAKHIHIPRVYPFLYFATSNVLLPSFSSKAGYVYVSIFSSKR